MKSVIIVIDGVNTVSFVPDESNENEALLPSVPLTITPVPLTITPVPLTITPVPLTDSSKGKGRGAKS